MNIPEKAEAGMVLCFFDGEYSEYQLDGSLVVIKDFNFLDVICEWQKSNTNIDDVYDLYEIGENEIKLLSDNHLDLYPFLISNGYAKEVRHVVINDYDVYSSDFQLEMECQIYGDDGL